MFSTITSGTVCGISSHLVQVEVDLSKGLPCFQMVGLLSSEVREARERVRVALKNSGIILPPVCINVNLSPADLRKEGTMFDLPVAVGILTCLGRLSKESTAGPAGGTGTERRGQAGTGRSACCHTGKGERDAKMYSAPG